VDRDFKSHDGGCLATLIFSVGGLSRATSITDTLGSGAHWRMLARAVETWAMSPVDFAFASMLAAFDSVLSQAHEHNSAVMVDVSPST